MNLQKSWQALSLALVLTMTALLIWTCSGAGQQSATSNTQAPVATTTPVGEATPTTSDAASASVQVFTIDQSQSAARFMLDEELMGSPKTVVGTTNLVEGAITIDLADLTKTTISPIQIDARGFATDSGRRDGAIQRFVLGSTSEENRYIVFTPTTITGFSATAAVGDTFELQITGDLTISGVTKAVTFVTSVTVTSESQISGLASAQILRSDYDLTIPSVPSVANVTDEVLLEFQFVAGA
jgi:polyisoprenoid-binding protein YceI